MSSKMTPIKKLSDLPKSFQRSNDSDRCACISSNSNDIINNNNHLGVNLSNLVKDLDPVANSLLLTLLLRAVGDKSVIKVDADTQTTNKKYLISSPQRSDKRSKHHRRKRSRERRSRHSRSRGRSSHKKRKRRRSGKKSGCSPSYSDYEPANPLLKLRAK